jgi:hypothetical protein
MKRITFKHIIFVVLLSLLTLPMIQHLTGLIKDKPLNGVFTETEFPDTLTGHWFNEDFQNQYCRYTEDHIGFRSFFISCYNQINFSLFKICNAKGITVGKENVLYEKCYFDTYLGKDTLNKIVIAEKVQKLKFLQDTLSKMNIQFIFLLAPGKVTFTESYLPDGISKPSSVKGNYELFVSEMSRNQIHLMDMRNYLLQVRDTSKHPPFPRCGTHWSAYSITLVADSLIKYCEYLTGRKLRKFDIIPGVVRRQNLPEADYDLGNLLNLLGEIPSWDMYYPLVAFHADSGNYKPIVLTIGDSFTESFWNFYPIFSELFNNKSTFWYYNRVIYKPCLNGRTNESVESNDNRKCIEKANIILMVSSEQNLCNFGFGFIDKAYSFYNTDSTFSLDLINYYESMITENPVWLARTTQKALLQKLSPRLMVRKDALWMLKENLNIRKNRIRYFEQSIQNDTTWLTKVKEKALKQNIPLTKMIRMDAIWMMNQEP